MVLQIVVYVSLARELGCDFLVDLVKGPLLANSGCDLFSALILHLSFYLWWVVITFLYLLFIMVITVFSLMNCNWFNRVLILPNIVELRPIINYNQQNIPNGTFPTIELRPGDSQLLGMFWWASLPVIYGWEVNAKSFRMHASNVMCATELILMRSPYGWIVKAKPNLLW